MCSLRKGSPDAHGLNWRQPSSVKLRRLARAERFKDVGSEDERAGQCQFGIDTRTGKEKPGQQKSKQQAQEDSNQKDPYTYF
jgi:hypothetical protein